MLLQGRGFFLLTFIIVLYFLNILKVFACVSCLIHVIYTNYCDVPSIMLLYDRTGIIIIIIIIIYDITQFFRCIVFLFCLCQYFHYSPLNPNDHFLKCFLSVNYHACCSIWIQQWIFWVNLPLNFSYITRLSIFQFIINYIWHTPQSRRTYSSINSTMVRYNYNLGYSVSVI